MKSAMRNAVVIILAKILVVIGLSSPNDVVKRAPLMSEEENPLVTIQDGKLKGIYMQSRENKTYAGFMGIPFADPPKRFEASKPVSPWTGTRDVTKYGPICPQLLFSPNLQGEEDCLSLNVFVPGFPLGTKPKLPVIVFVHGGGFQFGYPGQFGPLYLMDEGVILVTISYRMAALGFLSTGDGVIPGNLGLKDQLLALKWVQKNIDQFGGDPGQVTLYGQSAGGIAVCCHLVSPLSRGLFQKVIISSGSCLQQLSLQGNARENAFYFVKALNGSQRTTAEIKEALTSASLADLLRVSKQDANVFNNAWLAPVIEPPGPDAFLTELPLQLYERGDFAKVPLLLTANAQEGLISNSADIMANPDLVKEINSNWDTMAPKMYHYEHLSVNKRRAMSNAIHSFYFGKQTPILRKESFDDFTNTYTDLTIIAGVRENGLYHARHAPTYAAILDISGPYSIIVDNKNYKTPMGMCHIDDLQYVFNVDYHPDIAVDSERYIPSYRLVRQYANFAKFGNPNFDQNYKQWNPISESEVMTRDLNWMYIRNTFSFPLTSALDNRMRFCDKFYSYIGISLRKAKF